MNRFYKANEEVTLRFYQMPKVLFTNPLYEGLSLGAKAMYSILRDRQELSIKNNWIDEEGNIYLTFKIDPAQDDDRDISEKDVKDLSLTELLGINRKTVMNYKKELVKYGLIIDKRMGRGKTSRIYVLKPELNKVNFDTYEKSKKGASKSQKTNESIDIAKKSKKGTSRSPKKGLQEVQKRDTNDTDISDTDISDTQSVSQKEKTQKEKEPIGQTDRQTENTENIFKKIKDRLDIDSIKIAYPHDINLIDEILFNIFDMYCSNYTIIKGDRKPKELIRSVIMKLTYFHIEALINKYKQISTSTQITNYKAYMQTMIYNIAFENDLAVTNEVKYNFG